MRKPMIAGNWKMNKTVDEGVALVREILPLVQNSDAEICVCVPYISLQAIGELIQGSRVQLGAQNVSQYAAGAYTGEISTTMLADLKVAYVILGHSERRMYYAETDESINEKIEASLGKSLCPIVCCGEPLDIRRKNEEKAYVKAQLVRDLQGIRAEDMRKMVIAYEPIWAIGTGETASKEQAESMCAFIRTLIAGLYDSETADAVRILYGGSVNTSNIDELMGMENIDGALVGGASLKAADFARLVNFR